MIEIEKTDAETFRVTVTEGSGRTTHEVTVPAGVHRRLTGGSASIERLLQASFEFLLEREPKESILRRFDLEVIARYFPEYDEEMRRLLGGGPASRGR